MSDDLIKRARDCANGVGCTKTDRGDLGLFDDLADRIEELKKQLSHGSFYKESDIDALQDRLAELEAENQQLRAELEACAEMFPANEGVLRKAIQEIKGKTDE